MTALAAETTLSTQPQTGAIPEQRDLDNTRVSDDGRFTYDSHTGEFGIDIRPECSYLAPEIGRAVLTVMDLLYGEIAEDVMAADESELGVDAEETESPIEVLHVSVHTDDDGEVVSVRSQDPRALYRLLGSVADLPAADVAGETRQASAWVIDDLVMFTHVLALSGVDVEPLEEAIPARFLLEDSVSA